MTERRAGQDRKGVNLLVKLAHQGVDEFAEKYCTNLSPGGMFIRSREPQAIGTTIKFRIEIAAGVRVLQGAAIVRWVRHANDPAGPPGMGVQFQQLDPASQALIDRMMAAMAEREIEAARAAEQTISVDGAGDSPFSQIPTQSPAQARAAVRPAASPKPPPAASPGRPAAAARPAAAPAAPARPAAPVAPVAPIKPISAPIPAAKARPAPAPARIPTPPPMIEPEMEIPIDAPTIEVPSTPAGEIDIDVFSLIQGTPAPPPEDEIEIPMMEVAPPTIDLTAGVDIDVEDEPLSPPPAIVNAPPAPVAAAAPPMARPHPTGAPAIQPMPYKLDGPPVTTTRQAAAPPPAPVAAQVAPPRQQPPVAPPIAPPPPPQASPVAPAGALPEIRRDRAVEARAQAGSAPAPVLSKADQEARKPQPTRAPAAKPVFLQPPDKIPTTGPVIGIDLGTTNSACAVISKGRPQIMSTKDGYNTIPSVVALSKSNSLLVGRRAKAQTLLNPSQCITGAKRLVGRDFDSPTVREVRDRFHYDIVPGADGKAAVVLGEHTLSLEEVQGIILRECKQMAEAQLGESVHRAVITCPAYYSEPQREAVRKAAALAGLKVERVLNEPTAAALAYGLNREMSRKVLVYDLGGGTFDATLLRIDKNVFEVLATGGDVFLGGLDFDAQIVDFLLGKFQEQHGVAFSGDPVALSRVTDQAERSKVALSERTSTDVHLPMLQMSAKAEPMDLRCVMTRDELNQVCGDLVNRTMDVVRDVLLDAKVKSTELDDVLLVGGMSRMPLVREKIKEALKKTPHAGVNADEAVALGAALYSGTVDKVSSVVLIDVVPMTIGIGLPGGGFKRVIERNSPLPASKSFSLQNSRDNEEVIEFNVFQGEDQFIGGNDYLGTVRITDIPKGPKGTVQVAVTLKLDPECVLHVEARELRTRKLVSTTLATQYTPEEIRKKLGVADNKQSVAEEKRAEELKQRGGRFWGFIKRVIGRG